MDSDGRSGFFIAIKAVQVCLLCFVLYQLLSDCEICWNETNHLSHLPFHFPVKNLTYPNHNGTVFDKEKVAFDLFQSGIPSYALPKESVKFNYRSVCVQLTPPQIYCSETNLNPLSGDFCMGLIGLTTPTFVIGLALFLNSFHMAILFDTSQRPIGIGCAAVSIITLVMTLATLVMFAGFVRWESLWYMTPLIPPSYPVSWTNVKTELGCLMGVAIFELVLIVIQMQNQADHKPTEEEKSEEDKNAYRLKKLRSDEMMPLSSQNNR